MDGSEWVGVVNEFSSSLHLSVIKASSVLITAAVWALASFFTLGINKLNITFPFCD